MEVNVNCFILYRINLTLVVSLSKALRIYCHEGFNIFISMFEFSLLLLGI